MKIENNEKQSNKEQDNYMELGMSYGMVAGSAVMSILFALGQYGWGIFAIWAGLLIGMLIGLAIKKKK